MKEINNFDKISKLLKWNNNDEFYFIQIVKDANTIIKTFYIYNKYDLNDYEKQIKELCIQTQSQAYLYINNRNSKDIMCRTISKLSDCIRNNYNKLSPQIYNNMCREYRNYKSKPIYVITTHNLNSKLMYTLTQLIENYQIPIIEVLDTSTGFQYITEEFNSYQFKQVLKMQNLDNDITIYEDDTILLYNP